MPFTRCCTDGPPPNLQGWDPCPPLEIGDLNIGDITANVAVPLVAPEAGCVLVNGVLDPRAFAVIYGDNETAWFTVTTAGVIPVAASSVQQLDDCDERCLPTCCDLAGTEDCQCDCDGTDLAAAAQAFGNL